MKNNIIATFLLAAMSATVWAQGPNNSGTYYQSADGQQGAALKSALCSIIYDRNERSYANLWTDFMSTDVRDDGKVWDMYSDISNS